MDKTPNPNPKSYPILSSRREKELVTYLGYYAYTIKTLLLVGE